MSVNKDSILKAIRMGVSFAKPWDGKIRCFDNRCGYSEYIDLTEEEYNIYMKVMYQSLEELEIKLNKIVERE